MGPWRPRIVLATGRRKHDQGKLNYQSLHKVLSILRIILRALLLRQEAAIDMCFAMYAGSPIRLSRSN